VLLAIHPELVVELRSTELSWGSSRMSFDLHHLEISRLIPDRSARGHS
jgi:hypothetical protein